MCVLRCVNKEPAVFPVFTGVLKDNSMKEKKRIMIVDDEFEILKLLRLYLEHSGYEPGNILEAHGGEECVEMVESGLIPDLIVIDIMMPGLDGYRACGTLKSDPVHRRIKVVFYSALPEEEVKSKYRLYGAEGYILKGVAPEDFLGAIDGYLGIK